MCRLRPCGELGAPQRAAGHEQQCHQATRIPLGAVIPYVIARGNHLQARARSGGRRGRNQGSNRQPTP